MVEYYLWADGEYSCAEDGEPTSWKSDDYFIVEIPEDYEGDHDDYMHQMHLEINLGQMCEQRKLI